MGFIKIGNNLNNDDKDVLVTCAIGAGAPNYKELLWRNYNQVYKNN